MRRLIAAVAAMLACASPGMPPGGPPDVAAPEILAIAPDSGRTGIRPREVIFRFNEVVSERPPTQTTLADLFLISPREGTPAVSWNRDEIAVRPRRGWRTNTAYTVTMLPGLSDIRGNVRNTGASTFFSTGPAVPATRITGRVFDYATGAVAATAFVEAFAVPDTTRAYISLADSSGLFSLAYLPPGRYSVRAFSDRNRNRGIDPGEQWDSVSIDLADSATLELAVFVHDSVAPRIRDVVAVDSLSLQVVFDRPVDATQTLSTANFSIVGPDSARVPLAGISVAGDTTPPSVRPGAARDPTVTRPRADTTGIVRPTMSRPRPIGEVVIRLQRPLAPRTTYRVRAIGLRGLLGHTGDSERPFTTPAPPPPRTPGDSAAVPAIRR